MTPPSAPSRDRPSRILVAWFRFGPNGSVGRFVRFARHAAARGHVVEFLSLSGETRPEWPDMPRILSPEEARGLSWDAVMVPGAGNPADPLERLAELRDARFGRRIQHVLNDPSRLARFAEVNRILEPDLVVLNNSHWHASDLRHLAARAFHTLPGAVDTTLFAPHPAPTTATSPPGLRVGAYARKHFEVVLDAADRLPSDIVLHAFGTIPGELAPRADRLAARGRLVPFGELFGKSLAAFYRGLDVFAAVEDAAGWCNPAAEAMASGVACIATEPGTIDFVSPGENALRVERDGGPIAAAIASLAADPALRRTLGERAAASMRRWDWAPYCERLLALVATPPVHAYYRAEHLGLFGKWDPVERLAGLDPLLADARGAAVLDLGAAEGLVAAEMAHAGASVVHAFELDPDRVDAARALLRGLPAASTARVADLSRWEEFECAHVDLLLPRYDIVLFLGLYHHLPPGARDRALSGAIDRAGRWLAVRTPAAVAMSAGVTARCGRAGLRLESQREGSEGVGWLGLFRRAESPSAPVARPPVAEVRS